MAAWKQHKNLLSVSPHAESQVRSNATVRTWSIAVEKHVGIHANSLPRPLQFLGPSTLKSIQHHASHDPQRQESGCCFSARSTIIPAELLHRSDPISSPEAPF